ncbi:MAG: polysaccharide biosynthesis tyrosine autokinase [Cytophagaceae bacterium]
MAEDKDIIDFKSIGRTFVKYWYLAFLILTLCWIYSWFTVRYFTPIFQVKNSIQIKDKATNTSQRQQLYDGSSFFQITKNLNNEMELMKSYNQVQSVLKELDFTWEYMVAGSIKDLELYHNQPFLLIVDSNLVPTNAPFNVVAVSDKEYIIDFSYNGKQWYNLNSFSYNDSIGIPVQLQSKKFVFGDTITSGLLKYTIVKTPFFTSQTIGQKYTIIARDLHYLTKLYKNKLVTAKGDRSSIVNLSSTGTIVEKEVVFLNTVAKVYIDKDLADKNQIATNTINFIDAQLNIISDSLDFTSEGLQTYKEANKIYAISEQAQDLMTQIRSLEEQKLTLEIQLRYYLYLNDYINSGNETVDLVAPSTININDPILSNLVGQLIALYQEKNTLQYTSSEKSANYKALVSKISATRDALLETSRNLVKTTKLSISDFNSRVSVLEKELSKMPEKERALLNIQRKHTINDNIYNYLLQKRAEASIARASSLSDAFIVEYARPDEYIQVAPVSKSIYTKNILIGTGMILVLLVVYSTLDNKIKTKEDASSFTTLPVLGSIFYVDDSEEKSKTVYAGHNLLMESFRSLRTNLQYLVKGKKQVVIGVTSCISGDGKSFCSQNLAKVYALSGKKTILIHGDLRKPFELKYPFLNESIKGLSEYLIEAVSLKDIIYPSGEANLDVVIPGAIPPNASELFASEQMTQLIHNLKKDYDYVIIDSPPVGIVSDYLSVVNEVDINLFVIRHDYTPKHSLMELKSIATRHAEKKDANWIIYNGERTKGKGYNYAYSYNYFGGKNQKPWWKFWGA